jgi:hypothetical protein
MKMIGKADWFQRRKYGGWGISPRTWQGWLYVFLLLAPFMVFQALPFWSVKVRIIVSAAWMLFLFIDVSHIMLTLKRDEREHKIEAISERNAAWAMILVLILGLLYQTYVSAFTQQVRVDPFILGAIAAGVIAKSVSNIWLERKAI